MQPCSELDRRQEAENGANPGVLISQAAEKVRIVVELAFRPASKLFIFCHPQRTSVREEPAFRTFSATPLQPAALFREN